MTREIKITQGQVTLVDDEDYDFLNQWRWQLWRKKYVKRTHHFWIKEQKKYGSYHLYMHRVIMDALKGLVVDHINGNPLDNRKANLRICTNAQNITCGFRKLPKSGFRGVVASGKQFQARLAGKALGSFSCPKEAAKIYNNAAFELYGEFAVLNAIPETL